jgi:hypothetical protein
VCVCVCVSVSKPGSQEVLVCGCGRAGRWKGFPVRETDRGRKGRGDTDIE